MEVRLDCVAMIVIFFPDQSDKCGNRCRPLTSVSGSMVPTHTTFLDFSATTEWTAFCTHTRRVAD